MFSSFTNFTKSFLSPEKFKKMDSSGYCIGVFIYFPPYYTMCISYNYYHVRQ